MSEPQQKKPSDWLEQCRKEFIRRYWIENGDDYEFCPQVYGDEKCNQRK